MNDNNNNDDDDNVHDGSDIDDGINHCGIE